MLKNKDLAEEPWVRREEGIFSEPQRPSRKESHLRTREDVAVLGNSRTRILSTTGQLSAALIWLFS